MESSSERSHFTLKAKKARTETSTDSAEGIVNSKVSRRTFLKASVASAAVVGVGGLALKSPSMSKLQMATPSQASDPDLFAPVSITLNVNGQNYTTTVEPRAMLVNVLRENLYLTGTKRPCNRMECGGCTVVISDGTTTSAVYSCTYIATRAQGKQILTVEGSDTVLQALQSAWVPNDASQCGYCQPGRLMSATALLKSNPSPTVDQIKTAIDGNLCRCGTYINVLQAVQDAAKSL
jgi:aerobic-type carbon monoxide dehydrogenase small subunit (CoxS/CutS family)